jgi:hypothetical protein
LSAAAEFLAVDLPLTLTLLQMQRCIAECAVILDIESEGTRHSPRRGVGSVWDISALFDAREHSAELIDMANQAIAYGIAVGLIELLPGPPLRVCQLREPISPSAGQPASMSSFRSQSA